MSPPAPHPRPRGIRRVLQQPVTAVADAVMPAVVDAVDLDEAFERVDINHVIQRVDVNELVQRLDFEALLAKLDMDTLLDYIDLDRVLDRIDLNRLADRLDVDSLVRRVNLDRLLKEVDVDSLIKQVDVSSLIGRVDVDELLERISVDRLLDRVDVDRLIQRLDVDALIQRVDVDALVQRVDVDGLVRRVDVDGLVERVNVDGLIQRVNVDALVQRVDVDALVDRVNIEELTDRLELSSMISKSTGGLLKSFLDLLRRQVVGLDVLTMRGIDRVLRRRRDSLPVGPDRFEQADVGGEAAVSGRYAGPVSRLLAFVVDILLAGAMFAFTVSSASYVWKLVTGHSFSRTSGLGWTIGLLVWELVYFWLSWSIAGRTVGMTIVGIRIVGDEGSPITQRQSLGRAVAFPFSFILFLGFLLALFQRERRAFQDLVAKTCVVYDWGDRPAEMPGPLTRWLSKRGAMEASG